MLSYCYYEKKEKRRAYVDKEVDGVLEEDGDEDEEEANGSECPCRGVFESGAAGSGVHCHDGLNLFSTGCDCSCLILLGLM